jgi:uncharacterized protein YybS (DUF2232 family)
MVGAEQASNRSKGAGQLMMMPLLIALAAGGASALMFASIASGALISLVLFYLAPLPLMVAALGWGALSALIGGILASLFVGLTFGLPYLAAFAITVALPAWWLGHLCLLAKPVDGTSAQPALEWYPTGRLLAWIVAFASLTTMTALLSLGTDADTIANTLRSGLTRVLGAQDATGLDPEDLGKLIATLAAVGPAAATIVALVTLTINLWLAGKITQTSGRLPRPWPKLSTIELPQMMLAALLLAIAVCFTGGLAALFSQIITAALVMGYAFVGLAVLHMLTQANTMRGLWLGSAYAVVIVFGWPLLIVALLGIADAIFGFRRRMTPHLKPPTLST